MAAINDEIPKGWKLSHKEAFEQYDKPRIKTLSDGSFTLCDYVAYPSVPDNYHLYYDNHYYSVFYTYHKQPVILKATMTEISICDRNNRLICTHKRAYAPFPRYITKEEHMPAKDRFYKEINDHDGDYYRRWGAAIGSNTARMIDIVLRSFQHEEQAYNSCNGILHMCTGVSKDIVESVSAECIQLNACRYTYFKKLLNKAVSTGGCDDKQLPKHENIWGKDYYK